MAGRIDTVTVMRAARYWVLALGGLVVMMGLGLQTVKRGFSLRFMMIRMALPIIAFVVLTEFTRLFPIWLVFVVFPMKMPLGGGVMGMDAAFGVMLFGAGMVRHALKRDFITRENVPVILRVILLGLALGYLHNPALPTTLVYDYSGVGSGFKNYVIEFVKWTSLVYVFFYMSRQVRFDWILVYLRYVSWIGAFAKVGVLLFGGSYLFWLIGESYVAQLFTGYIGRFFFVTSAFGSALAVTLCWKPRHWLLAKAKPLLMAFCLLAMAAGGTRSSLLTGIAMVGTYFVYRRKWRLIALVGAALLSLFALFHASPSFRQMVPEKIQRAFVFSKETQELEGLGAEASKAMNTLEWRRELAHEAWEDIKQSPILPQGYRAASIIFEAGGAAVGFERKIHLGLTHNFYLTTMIVYGIPFALVIFGFLGWVFWKGLMIIWEDPKQRADSLLAYCLLVIPPIFLVGFFKDMALLPEMVLVSMAYVQIIRYRRDPESVFPAEPMARRQSRFGLPRIV